MKSQRYAFLLVLLVLSLLLAACGAGETDTTPVPGGAEEGMATEAPVTGAEEPLATEPVAGEAEPAATEEVAGAETPEVLPEAGDATRIQLLGWSSSDAENQRLNEMIQNFNESQTAVSATFNPVPEYDTTLQTALAGGAPPDVFYLDADNFPDFVGENVLMEPPEGAIENPDDFYEPLREAFTADGVFYCPPKDFSTLALQYNEQMLQDAGVEVPTTWEELRAAAEALTNADEGVYGLVLPTDPARWIAFLYQAGGHVLDDQGNMDINTPEAQEALDFYMGMIQDGVAATPPTVNAGWPGEAFGSQSAAMVIEGNWIVPYLELDFPDLEYGIAELPAGPGGQATLAFTVCYAVAQNAPNPDASWELVSYLTGPEGMQAWTDLGLAMPTRESLEAGWIEQFPELEPFLAGADYAQPFQFAPGFQTVIDTLSAGMQQIEAGQATVEQVLEEVQQVGEDSMSQ